MEQANTYLRDCGEQWTARVQPELEAQRQRLRRLRGRQVEQLELSLAANQRPEQIKDKQRQEKQKANDWALRGSRTPREWGDDDRPRPLPDLGCRLHAISGHINTLTLTPPGSVDHNTLLAVTTSQHENDIGDPDLQWLSFHDPSARDKLFNAGRNRRKKQSEAALLHVRVDGLVRPLMRMGLSPYIPSHAELFHLHTMTRRLQVWQGPVELLPIYSLTE